MWPDLIQKAKEGGIDAIETYIFWNHHEPRRGKYHFSGNLNFVKFFKLVQKAGLHVILRIGPYVCAEWNYGGFPVWLHNLPGVQLRTDNQVYKDEMQRFTTKIVNLCKEANLFAPQGGPIIFAQIENEYGNIMEPYGAAGKSYIQWCATMAESLNISVPWIMCQQSDAPQTMINTCNGFYCDKFTPNNPESPKMWTENWTGWYKNWGGKDPYRTAEDVAYAVARFFQTGGVFQNYYMYHGGTNFGRSAGGPFIATSYDYNAPLDEYGNLNQPKWGHLKQLHAAIKSGQKVLTSSSPSTTQIGNGVDLTTYINNPVGEKFCFLSNKNTTEDAHVDLKQDGNYFVPAWSVTILAGCNKEIYNTAKVNTQTSVIVKKSDGSKNESAAKLQWAWISEPMWDVLTGKGRFRQTKLLEQKEATGDASDYLWYMTTVEINDTATWTNAILRVNTTGHVLHAYVNQNFTGSQWTADGDHRFIFEKPVTLKSGTNFISLLSATVGLQNYGSFYDLSPAGIVGGPVQLIGKGNVTKDLSSNPWSYKIGLGGERVKLYKVNKSPMSAGRGKWAFKGLPSGKPMIWYRTNFNAPSGTDPVVVDLQGMGKGQAWVNGRSIGRYWPSFLANKDGCNTTCDYRGEYSSEKCGMNCGNPTQRWYHIPRSYLGNRKHTNTNTNTLTLFEEIGGDPSQVSFQTLSIGFVCGSVYEGKTLELSCQGGQTISEIQFASFGDPQGNCGSFKKGSGEAVNSLSTVQKACVGKTTCSFNATEATFGSVNCGHKYSKRLLVQGVCDK
ncbi:beta-galactosidase [Corylus avellana]|uniref:beta-galactosidase n=1 Tax=Corylus avellana TaxID=13451 RepID=UPI00286BF037|nr:beta-galactosidase [Corylus avellana]